MMSSESQAHLRDPAGEIGGEPLGDELPRNTGPNGIPRSKYEEFTDPGQIRILHLHKTEGDTVEFDFKLVQHSDGGYQTLSYVWGSEDKLFRAIVRDETGTALGYIPLTLSLVDVLRNLRDSDEVTSKLFGSTRSASTSRATKEPPGGHDGRYLQE